MPRRTFRPPLPPEDLEHVLAHAAGCWEELRGQRLFITGGTGFFGSWLLESLALANDRLGLGVEATVLTRSIEGFFGKSPHLADRDDFRFVEGDVRSFAAPDGPFPYIIHAATESCTDLPDTQPLQTIQTIVDGTRQVLEFAARAGTRKLLYTSTGAVYGPQPADLAHMPEDYRGAPDQLEPRSAYAEAKRLAENLCVLFGRTSGVEIKIARCFAIVGPHLPLDAHLVIGNFIRDAMGEGPIRVRGDGTPYRSYLYSSDLAAWLWTILCRGRSGTAYNVGSTRAVTIAQLAAEVNSAFGGRTGIQIAEKAVPGRPASRYVPDTARCGRELALFELIGLREAILKTAAWHSTQKMPAASPTLIPLIA